MRARVLAFGAILAVAAAFPAHGDSAFTVSLTGPTSTPAGTPTTFVATVALANAVGAPGQRVELLVDGAFASESITRVDGRAPLILSFAVEGTYELRAVTHRGTPLEASSAPMSVTVGPGNPLAITIAGARAQRIPGRVLVTVELVGAAEPGTAVTGSVTVTAPNPCWPDPGTTCADVIDEQTLGFEAVAGSGGAWSADVGPYDYAALAGPACNRLKVSAEALVDGARATDERFVDLCV